MGGLLGDLLVVVVAFVAMEPVTYLVHRFVMHGPGRRLHRSHHRSGGRSSRFEANDWFPVAFAALVLAGLAVGFNVPGFGALVPVGIGVTGYGLAYGLVHDGYIHGRVPWPFGRWAVLDRLAEAHRLHHRFNGEPYGMLVPVVPPALRERAGQSPASGSRPSQVPAEP